MERVPTQVTFLETRGREDASTESRPTAVKYPCSVVRTREPALAVPKRRCIGPVIVGTVRVVVATGIANDVASSIENRLKAGGTDHRERRTALKNGHVGKFPTAQQLVHEAAAVWTGKRPQGGKRQTLSDVEIGQSAAQAVVECVDVFCSVEFAGLINCFREGVGGVHSHAVTGALTHRSSETVVAAALAVLSEVDGSEPRGQ